MKKMALTAVAACFALGAGCSRPTADSTAAATPTPQQVKGQVATEHTTLQPSSDDQPILTPTPSPSPSNPKP